MLMTPGYWSAFAVKWHARRWLLMAISLIGFACLALAVAKARAPAALVALAGPVVFLPWGLFCACMWFHPTDGRLQAGRGMMARLPVAMQGFVRWYAALFLFMYTIVSALVWPVFGLIGVLSR
jgi:hypothetical protein